MSIKAICDADKCTGCGACMQSCQKNAISMKKNNEGFFYPEIDKNKCIECSKCINICPINRNFQKYESSFYMGWHKNKKILRMSSSGGAFSGISEFVFSRKGVVFGVVCDEKNGNLKFAVAENSKELHRQRLSKYYQCNADNVYKKVKEYLDKDQIVLFSGTACQVAGLLSFLGKKRYKNLITVDVLCHGVASKYVIDEYIKSQEKRFRKKIKSISFRVKDGKKNWSDGGSSRMKLFFEDGTNFTEDNWTDYYFLGFNNNFFLRESCYNCKFCGTERISDFTLADFWGCKNAPEEQLKCGISLILQNNSECICSVSDLQKYLHIEKINPDSAIPYNRALSIPQKRPPERDLFFKLLDEKGFNGAMHKVMGKTLILLRIKKFIKGIIGEEIYRKLKSSFRRILKRKDEN